MSLSMAAPGPLDCTTKSHPRAAVRVSTCCHMLLSRACYDRIFSAGTSSYNMRLTEMTGSVKLPGFGAPTSRGLHLAHSRLVEAWDPGADGVFPCRLFARNQQGRLLIHGVLCPCGVCVDLLPRYKIGLHMHLVANKQLSAMIASCPL